jgi:formate hydrogenlyase subunit 3/multisubunit Na+/H+ antiporter MnhD subunit
MAVLPGPSADRTSMNGVILTTSAFNLLILYELSSAT